MTILLVLKQRDASYDFLLLADWL